MCASRHTCGSSGVSHTEHLCTNGSRDVGARGHGIVIAQKMSIVLGQVVENQRSVQRTVRRDRTTSFLFVLADFNTKHESKRVTGLCNGVESARSD